MAQVLLADEMDLVTRGVRSLLLDFPDWAVAGECHSLNEALKQLSLSVVDVVVCGEQIDPSYDVLSLVEKLRSAAPNVHIILIGSVADGRLLRDLLHSGVRAYLNRGDPLSDCLPMAIRAILKESLYLSPTANTDYLVAMQSSKRPRYLDSEARLVLRLLAQGCTIGIIADQLSVSQRHIYWVCQKLRNRFGATTNEQMISCAIAEGYASAYD